MKNKILLIILAIIILVLVISVVIAFAIVDCKCASTFCDLSLSDWLAFAGVVLSLFGTTFLSFVAISQTSKANETNDKLLKLNEDLQKSNDYQFKLSNQDSYPVLTADGFTSDIDVQAEQYFELGNWQNSFETNLENGTVFVNVDCRKSEVAEAKAFSMAGFSLKNNSNSKIKKIKIYKLDLHYPLNNIRNVNWSFDTFLEANDRQHFELYFCYEENNRFDNSHIGFALYLEIETITGLKFYEKISIHVFGSYANTNIEKLSHEKITN